MQVCMDCTNKLLLFCNYENIYEKIEKYWRLVKKLHTYIPSVIIMPATTTTPPPSIIPYMREIRSLAIGIVGTQTASFYEVQVNWRKGQKVNVCIYCPQLFS